MKHLGITNKRGDDSYEYESRCMLGQLEARMKTTGQKFGSWVRTLEDGTAIVATIIMNGASPIYRVNVVAEEEELEALAQELAFMETGMCHVVSFAEATFEAEIVLPDNARDRYNSAAAPDYRTWLDWLVERNGSLGNITRVNADRIPSMSMVNRAEYDATEGGWEGVPTGKELLLWQAQLGLLSPSAPPYDGPTIPST